MYAPHYHKQEYSFDKNISHRIAENTNVAIVKILVNLNVAVQ